MSIKDEEMEKKKKRMNSKVQRLWTMKS